MPQTASGSVSSLTSKDWLDLDLPIIRPGEEPLPCEPPDFFEQLVHARFLLSCQPSDFFQKRLAQMNPEPFVMI